MNALAGVGDGRIYMYDRLNLVLDHSDNPRYNEFINDCVMSVANRNTMISLTQIDYGHLNPLEEEEEEDTVKNV